MTFYWVFFAVFSTAHLLACLFDKRKIRIATKIMILPLLAVGLLISKTYDTLLFVGLLFGWIGDILLILPENRSLFVSGALSFSLGHFSYIAAMLIKYFKTNSVTDIPSYFYAIPVAILIALTLTVYIALQKRIGVIAYLGAFYFTVLSTTLVFSIFTHQYVLAVAFTAFIVSDITLSVCQFFKKLKREDFYVMSTYILAQCLICISFIYA